MDRIDRAHAGLMMRWRTALLVLAFPGFIVSGCGVSSPAPRLDAYLGTATQPDAATVAGLPTGLRVGLAVINDAAGPESAPPLSEGALVFVTDQARQHISRALPLAVVKVAPSSTRKTGEAPVAWEQVALEQGVDHLLLAVISSVEVTSATTLPLDGTQEGGGAMGRLPGSSTVQHALAELALLDAKTGAVLARAEGRTFSTLEQLAGRLTSNAYPVIRRSGRMQRIAAPRDDAEAHDVLRSLAADEAIELAAYNLKGRWDRARPAP
ncbi:MAG TPA: hypothetical protein VLA99_07610 [Nitrospiraceae bacterium]|nr:hypothetical protein [Nitrospiraceae bacterium]